MGDVPESEVPRPTQLVVPFEALKAKLAERLGDAEPEPEPEREAFVKHAAFERQTDASGETRYHSPTDCEGTLRVEDDSRPVWIMVCDACGFEVGMPMEKVDPNRLLEVRLDRAGLPDAFRGKHFDSSDDAQQPTLMVCRQWLRSFRPVALARSLPAIGLWGQPGRGKTHLLALIVETLIRNYKADAMYRPAGELFDELQAGLDSAAYEIRWQRAIRVKVLALDDLGATRMTDWRRDRLASLVDYRYSKELPLIFATNVPPQAWAKVFGERTASRLSGMVLPLRLEGPDRRAQGVQQQLAGASALTQTGGIK